MDLSKYMEVEYKSLQKKLVSKKAESDATDIKLAVDLDIKSASTVRNAFNYEEQMASDEVLSKVSTAIGLDLIVGWVNGQRRYFISKQ